MQKYHNNFISISTAVQERDSERRDLRQRTILLRASENKKENKTRDKSQDTPIRKSIQQINLLVAITHQRFKMKSSIILAVVLCTTLIAAAPYSRDNPKGEIAPCEYYAQDGSTFTVTCPDDESGSPYTCDEGPNDAPWALINKGQTGNFTFCDIPYNLTQEDACAVFNATGSEIPDVAGVVCDTGVSCDAGPVEYTDDGETLDLYFCGSVPTGPNYLRKLLENVCEVENSTGVITTEKCDEKYGWACTYGPIDVQDSYGFFGTYDETLSLTFCEPTGGLTDPLDVFYNRRRDGTRNPKAGAGKGKGKGKARGK